MVFDSISSNIDEVLPIKPSAIVFVFGDFSSVIRTGSPILVGQIDLVNSVIIFLSLLRWLTFLFGSLADSHSCACFALFISSDASICSTMALPLWESLIMSQFLLTFQ